MGLISAISACLDSLQNVTSSAVANMGGNFEYELVLLGQLRGKENAEAARESDVDSLGSSTASNFTFLQTGQFARLAEQLNPYMGSESRIEALKLMLHAQVTIKLSCAGESELPLIFFAFVFYGHCCTKKTF